MLIPPRPPICRDPRERLLSSTAARRCGSAGFLDNLLHREPPVVPPLRSHPPPCVNHLRIRLRLDRPCGLGFGWRVRRHSSHDRGDARCDEAPESSLVWHDDLGSHRTLARADELRCAIGRPRTVSPRRPRVRVVRARPPSKRSASASQAAFSAERGEGCSHVSIRTRARSSPRSRSRTSPRIASANGRCRNSGLISTSRDGRTKLIALVRAIAKCERISWSRRCTSDCRGLASDGSNVRTACERSMGASPLPYSHPCRRNWVLTIRSRQPFCPQ